MSNSHFTIRTKGGPHNGEKREIQSGVIPWPPPANLPGIFHGGVYILRGFAVDLKTKFRVADYEWVEYRKG